MCVLRSRQPGHLNVRAVLRHFVPYKGLHPLRRMRVYPSALCNGNSLLAQTIPAAKLRGVQFGRKPKEKPPEYPAVLEMWRRKELSARAAAVRLGVTHKMFQKWAEQDTLR